jgi:uncharacterized protein
MEIKGEYKFDVSQAALWEVLHDPRALGLIIPLVMNMKQVAENQYTGSLFFRVGSVAGTFHGKIELLNLLEPKSYDIKVHGSSSIGEVNITGAMSLEPLDKGTMMFYHGHIHFGGRIASVGSRLLEISTRTMIQQSFGTLGKYLSVKYK